MADDTSSPDDDAREDDVKSDTPQDDQPARDEIDWVKEARKWEARAKQNSDAAARLAAIEDANKTEAQRAADAQAAAEHRAAEAEARAMRREVALDFSLSKSDAALLDSVTDEDAMRALAKRLAQPSEPQQRGNYSRLEGTLPNSRPADEDMRAWVDDLAARAR